MDKDTIREGLRRLLPVLEVMAAITPNKFDDVAVAFLKSLLADPSKLAAAVDAAG